jgi:hypothetical protein
MLIKNAVAFGMLLVFLAPAELVAQAIGEYGRTVEGTRQKQRASPRASEHLRTRKVRVLFKGSAM